MNDDDTRRFESFLRAQECAGLNAAYVEPNSLAAELLARLSAVINGIRKQLDRQSSNRRATQQGTTGKASARDRIRLDLRAIARTARGMAQAMPGLEDRFRVPHRASDQALLSAARTFARDAEPLKAEFVRHGLPVDFIADLEADIAAFEQAATGQTQGAEEQVAATAAIDQLLGDGQRLMLRLDPVMRNLFASEPGLLAQWQSAHRVERSPHRSRGTTAVAAAESV